ncbi:MAG TPA: carboxypeptidase-like regulatory domain-containing protein [Nitrospirota bacterium]
MSRGMRWMAFAAFFAALMVTLASCSRSVGDTGIKGVAVLDGSGAGGASVSVYDADEKGGSLPVGTANTDPDGNFSVELPPGSYFIEVSLEKDDGPSYVSKVSPVPVVVTSGIAWAGEVELEKDTGEYGMTPGTGVAGSVVMDGQPVADAALYLSRSMENPSHRERGRTAVDGWFTVNIRPGRYYVTVVKTCEGPAADGLMPPSFSGECVRNPVIVRDGEYTNLGAITLAGPGETAQAGTGVDVPGEQAPAQAAGNQ